MDPTPAEHFHGQLRQGLDSFTWAVRQVPEQRRSASPPRSLGEWSAARHLFHLSFYEQHLALPALRWWTGGPVPDGGAVAPEDAAWEQADGPERLLEQFAALREEQLSLLSTVEPAVWNEWRVTVWGPVTLHWVMTKTVQHTHEHIHDVLSLALFWDFSGGRAEQAPTRS